MTPGSYGLCLLSPQSILYLLRKLCWGGASPRLPGAGQTGDTSAQQARGSRGRCVTPWHAAQSPHGRQTVVPSGSYPSFLTPPPYPCGTASVASPSFKNHRIPFLLLTAHPPTQYQDLCPGLALLQTWFPPMTSSSPLSSNARRSQVHPDFSSLSLGDSFSMGGPFCSPPQGTFGNVWGHFWLSQLRSVLLESSKRGPESCSPSYSAQGSPHDKEVP